MSSTEELVAPIGARWVRERARHQLKEGTHPVWAAYRACAGSAFALTGVLWCAGKAGSGVPDGDHHRGGAAAAVAGCAHQRGRLVAETPASVPLQVMPELLAPEPTCGSGRRALDHPPRQRNES